MSDGAEVEYRICGENERVGKWEGLPHASSLKSAEREAYELGLRNENVRIEQRTVTYTPWQPLSEQKEREES